MDGALGNGASISVSTLSVGSHTITASVTDNDAASVSATLMLTITARPPAAESGGGGGTGLTGHLVFDPLRLWAPTARLPVRLVWPDQRTAKPLTVGLAVGVLLLLVSCKERTGGDDVSTLYVDRQVVDCEGVAPQKCLLTKTKPDSDWEYFYDSIEGFQHAPGCAYELRVDVSVVANPPADGSSRRYELVEVIDRSCNDLTPLD